MAELLKRDAAKVLQIAQEQAGHLKKTVLARMNIIPKDIEMVEKELSDVSVLYARIEQLAADNPDNYRAKKDS